MNFSRKNRAPDGEMTMTPMIDMVFLLLIFFMCATKFRTVEGKIDSNLPADGTKPTPPPAVLPEKYIIYLDPADARFEGYDIAREYRSEADVRLQLDGRPLASYDALERELSAVFSLANRNPDKVAVEIAANEYLAFQPVAEAIGRCHKVGIQQLKFRLPQIHATSRYPIRW